LKGRIFNDAKTAYESAQIVFRVDYRPDCAVLWTAIRFPQWASSKNSSLLAILDDDESIQSALQDLIESEGLWTSAIYSTREAEFVGHMDQFD
jgi:hypothetical protein